MSIFGFRKRLLDVNSIQELMSQRMFLVESSTCAWDHFPASHRLPFHELHHLQLASTLNASCSLS